MRFSRLITVLGLILLGNSVYGQYYMWNAGENGVAAQYGRSRTGEFGANGFDVTIKSRSRSGIHLQFSSADNDLSAGASSYGVAYEHYFSPDAGDEFRSEEAPKSYVAPVVSFGVVADVFERGRSAFGGLPELGLAVVSPVGPKSRNVTSFSLSAWLPVVSSKYFDPDKTLWATLATTQSFRLSPVSSFTLGASYSISTEPETRNTLVLRFGLVFGWLPDTEETMDEW